MLRMVSTRPKKVEMPTADEVVELINSAVSDEERAAIEASHLTQTDNSARDGDLPTDPA